MRSRFFNLINRVSSGFEPCSPHSQRGILPHKLKTLFVILYGERDSNSQNLDPKSSAYTVPPSPHYLLPIRILTCNTRIKVLCLTFHYRAICLRSRIRTCNLPRPRRVNNHRYLLRFFVFLLHKKSISVRRCLTIL